MKLIEFLWSTNFYRKNNNDKIQVTLSRLKSISKTKLSFKYESFHKNSTFFVTAIWQKRDCTYEMFQTLKKFVGSPKNLICQKSFSTLFQIFRVTIQKRNFFHIGYSHLTSIIFIISSFFSLTHAKWKMDLQTHTPDLQKERKTLSLLSFINCDENNNCSSLYNINLLNWDIFVVINFKLQFTFLIWLLHCYHGYITVNVLFMYPNS